MIATVTSIMMSDVRYGKLPPAAQRDVEARVALCMRLDQADNKKRTAELEALRSHAGVTLSARTILNFYRDKWTATGRDWHALIDRARWPEKKSDVAPEFLEHWHQLCYRFKGERRHAAAYRALERSWHAGETIPGVADLAPDGRRSLLPDGLSYRNLMRPKYRPTKVADRVANIGLKAAAEFLPGVLSTRVGLAFGSRYVFDDMWHNVKVTVPGQMGSRRLLMFHAIELLSGCQFARGYKPEILNDKTGKFERLKEREFLFLVAHTLCQVGYNPAGCMLMMENGTANVNQHVEDMIARFSGGAVTVNRGATSKGQLAPGLYGGQSGGNFRFKAALESLGHLVQNEMSDRLLLPMQTGTNSRIDAPEELHDQEKHQLQLQKAALAVPAELRAMLRLPAPPLQAAIEIAECVQEEMNNRHTHDLEGWEACGFSVPEYRLTLDAPFQPQTQLLALPEAAQAVIKQVIESDKRLMRARMMSPREVFNGMQHQLTRLPVHALPALIGMENAQEKRVGKDGRFHFDDEALGPGEHHYEGGATDTEGHTIPLKPGEKYAVFVSAVDPRRLYACDAQGRFVGWCERTLVPSKADEHGIARAMGRKMAAHKELLAPVLAAARPIHQRIQQDIAANNAVLEAAKATRSEPRKAEQRAKQERRANIDRELAQAREQQAAISTTETPEPGGLYEALNED